MSTNTAKITAAALLLAVFSFGPSEAQAQVTIYKDSVRSVSLSGYIQAQFQYQKSNPLAVPSFDGGAFAPNVDSRFMLRRGRLGVTYKEKFVTANLESDYVLNEVRVANAILTFTEQRYKTFSFGMGLAALPFGFEPQASSFNMESPELSRVTQSLFLDGKDAGAFVGINPKTGPWNFISANFALLNGTGRKFSAYDSKRNLSGTLQFDLAKKVKSSVVPILGLGVSYYNGRSRSNVDTMYFSKGNDYEVNRGNENQYAKRIYSGANLQTGFKTPLGLTKLNVEYMQGKQPGVAGDKVPGPTASQSFTEQPKTPIYNREFIGYMVMLNQSIVNTPLNILLKYDWYDPNRHASGMDIGRVGSHTTAGDIAYGSLVAGAYLNLLEGRARISAYYDWVTNEETNVPRYTSDVNDDVFTLRMQYKF